MRINAHFSADRQAHSCLGNFAPVGGKWRFMLEPPSDLIAEQKSMLNAMIRLGGWRSTHLAQAANLAPSTVNKFLKEAAPKTALSARTIAKLLEATAHRLHAINAGRDELREFAALKKSNNWLDTISSWEANQRRFVMPITVVGAVGMGQYVPEALWPPEKHYELPFPQTMIDAKNPFAVEVCGQAMDRVYPVGTVLICVAIADLDRNIRPGERVICHLCRTTDGWVMPDVRMYVIDKAGAQWLVPDSTDPTIPNWPVGPISSTEAAIISAVVIASYRRES